MRIKTLILIDEIDKNTSDHLTFFSPPRPGEHVATPRGGTIASGRGDDGTVPRRCIEWPSTQTSSVGNLREI